MVYNRLDEVRFFVEGDDFVVGPEGVERGWVEAAFLVQQQHREYDIRGVHLYFVLKEAQLCCIGTTSTKPFVSVTKANLSKS